MRSLSTDAIVLRKQNRGECDQSITLFSPVFGNFQALAKGARKVSSKFSGHLEPLNICSLELHHSAHGYTITQCQAVKTYRYLRNDLKKSLLSMLILEVFQKSTRTHGQGRELFNLIEQTLDNISSGTKYSLIVESFKIKLMQILGILPEVERCSFCHRKWDQDKEIFLDGGGQFSCMNCKPSHKITQTTPFNIIKLINFICRNDYREIIKIRLPPKEGTLLKKISSAFLCRYLDHEILSEKILGRF